MPNHLEVNRRSHQLATQSSTPNKGHNAAVCMRHVHVAAYSNTSDSMAVQDQQNMHAPTCSPMATITLTSSPASQLSGTATWGPAHLPPPMTQRPAAPTPNVSPSPISILHSSVTPQPSNSPQLDLRMQPERAPQPSFEADISGGLGMLAEAASLSMSRTPSSERIFPIIDHLLKLVSSMPVHYGRIREHLEEIAETQRHVLKEMNIRAQGSQEDVVQELLQLANAQTQQLLQLTACPAFRAA